MIINTAILEVMKEEREEARKEIKELESQTYSLNQFTLIQQDKIILERLKERENYISTLLMRIKDYYTIEESES